MPAGVNVLVAGGTRSATPHGYEGHPCVGAAGPGSSSSSAATTILRMPFAEWLNWHNGNCSSSRASLCVAPGLAQHASRYRGTD